MWQDKIRNPNCTLCSLHEHAEHVCLMGTGKKSAKIMIVGEAPGEREDEEHAAFVGPAGQLLTTLLQEIGISRDECYITNAAKCRPLANATPTRAQAQTCQRAYGAKEVGVLRPAWILTLGNVALQALTGKSGITKHRGKLYSYEDIPVFPTFHPAAALRSSHYLDPIRADLRNFARRVGKGGGMASAPTHTRLITTRSALGALLSRLEQADTIAFDLETTGLYEWEKNQHIVTIGVCWATGECAVIPVYHENSKKLPPPDFIFASLKPILESKDKKLIAHNGKFDCKWLAVHARIFVPLSFDTMIAAHLLDENRSKGLKNLSQLLLDADDYDIDVKNAHQQPLKKLAIYNGKDCDYTLRLYHIFRKQLAEEPRLARIFKFLMMPASDVFTQLEVRGIRIDPVRLAARTQTATRNLAALEQYMGADINYNSPQQVAKWLFKDLKLPIIERTPTDAPSTKESVLLQLSKQDRRVRALLKYRKWAKYLSTYLGPWGDSADGHNRIHPSYRLTGTVTGRLSSADPNLQQVPRDPFIRGILGVPRGWVLIEADYSQIELRLAAMLAHERTMLRVLREGEDLHLNTASAILNKDPVAITTDERVIWGKHPNFGMIFGISAKGYKDYCANNGIYLSLSEAESVHSRFHSTYPNLRAWHARQARLAHRYQRVQSLIGRVRHLPDVLSTNESVRAEAERYAINSPVQSLASDLCLVSLVRLGQTLDHRMARIVGSIHDSLLLEVREEYVEQVVETTRTTMEDVSWIRRKFGAIIDVPIEVEVKVGTHWSEGEVVPRVD